MTIAEDDPHHAEATRQDVKRMRLRRPGICSCGADVAAGASAGWDRARRQVICPACLDNEVASSPSPDIAPPEEIEVGQAGASLRREHERRRNAREERIRSKHKRLGGLILALSDDPASTRAFATGADGEERLAARLEKDCAPDVLFLHNRRLGHGRRDGDIDHVAIAASGVYLIDAKRYPNAKVRVRRTGGVFSAARAQLMIGGRDRSKLLTGCAKQAEALSAALVGHPAADTVVVRSLLCFIDADLPLFGAMEMGGVRLLGPRAVVKTIRAPGELDAPTRASLHRHLAGALPIA
ncbi:nuclease-related domain-containing protein [Nocardioides sp.]|uniref:nuclease-related domain-containing protein n=1 Tax=Nocardioides sp. TaxID=35761 RepID=UPI0027360CB5|nr:nuclease-related domain-containing protein [Nocardioides sp.]MDP3891977.1 nuclease-related domain-containing protein [Nocardioides sp.]